MSVYGTALDHLAELPHYVYEAWMGDVALYVGMTCDLGRRLREHSQQQPWWKGADRFAVTVHPTRLAAEEAERVRIRELRPANNIRGNGEVALSWDYPDYDETRDLSPEDFASLQRALGGMFAGRPA